jgi:hypothetical protein
MMDSPHFEKRNHSRTRTLPMVRVQTVRQITRGTLRQIDTGQNISNFNENNNTVREVFARIRPAIWTETFRRPGYSGAKKGCAKRTPNPNREPLGNGAKPSP